MKSTQMYVVTGVLFTTLAAGLVMQTSAQESTIKIQVPLGQTRVERGGSGIGKQEAPQDTNPIGKELPQTDDFSTWCGQVRPILEEAWDLSADALHQVSQDGNVSSVRASWNALYQGLQAASGRAAAISDGVTLQSSVTWRLIDRGLKVADKLKAVYLCEGFEGSGCVRNPQGDVMILDFLRAYYNHVDTSLVRLDNQYLTGITRYWSDLISFDREFLVIRGRLQQDSSFVDCLRDPSICTSKHGAVMEHQRRYVSYAQNQLNWLNRFAVRKGTIADIEDGIETRADIYIAAYETRYYMIIAQAILGSIKAELKSTIYANSFACLIERIDRLASRVARYNSATAALSNAPLIQGDTTQGVQAILTPRQQSVEDLNRVVGTLDQLVNDIKTTNCHGVISPKAEFTIEEKQ